MVEQWREKKNEKIENYVKDLAEIWDNSVFETKDKLTEFIKYVPKHSLMQFICRYDLYKLIENIPGDIIELGVCGGRGLFSFIQSVFINEPQYQWRNIIGFDTFEGFPSIHNNDLNNHDNNKFIGAYKYNNLDELIKLKSIHENFRFINDREQIQFIKGNLMQTLPEYIENNKGLLVSLLYCDMDLYEPTYYALKLLWSRIPKGGIVVFDEAIMKIWHGEMIALHEALGIGNLKMIKIPYLKQFYIIKE